MKKGSILATLLVLLALSLTAFAQDEERDIVEISFYGGLGIPGGGLTDWKTQDQERPAKTGFDFGMDLGYFLRPNFVVGFNFVYTEFTIEENDEASSHNHRLYNPNLYAKYLFEGESNWAPYLKGHLGLENPKFSTFVDNPAGRRFRELSYNPAVAFGAGLGLIYYTAYYSSLFVEVNYHQALTKDVEATYQDQAYRFGENLGTLDVHAGIRVLFGSGD